MVMLNTANINARMKRNHKVRRVRIYMSLFPQCVAIAPDRLEQASASEYLELLAQMTNVDFQHMGVDFGMISPDALQDLLAAQNLPGMAHEEQQECVLLGGQFYPMSCPLYLSGGLVEL